MKSAADRAGSRRPADSSLPARSLDQPRASALCGSSPRRTVLRPACPEPLADRAQIAWPRLPSYCVRLRSANRPGPGPRIGSAHTPKSTDSGAKPINRGVGLEQGIREKDSFIRVTTVSALGPGDCYPILVDSSERVVVNTGDAFRAVDGICTHEFARLCEGDVDGAILWCPLHASGFDLTTGEAICPPATEGLRTYDVLVIDDEVWVARVARDTT